MQTGVPPRGVSRKAAYPATCKQEEKWLFAENFRAPHQVPSDLEYMRQFGHLIWDYETDSMIDGYARFARWVGSSRKKHSVPYPQMSGDANFERTLRAQHNSLEFFPVFMITLWTSTIFFNQVASAVIGLVYIYSRHQYFVGYCKSVEGRLSGFKLGVKCLMLMATLAVVGFVNVLVRMHTGTDLGAAVKDYLKIDFGK